MESILGAVVDDKAPVRAALGRLLRLAGCRVAAFESGEQFFASLVHCVPACALLDVNMPGRSGLHVQAQLSARHIAVPVVFIAASDDPDITRLIGCPLQSRRNPRYLYGLSRSARGK